MSGARPDQGQIPDLVAVIGLGGIGASWAALAAAAGINVAVYDADDAVAAQANQRLAQLLSDLEDLRGVPERLGRITVAPSIAAAVEGAHLVHEAVIEDLPAKRKIFAAVEDAAPRDALMTSSTSTFPAQSMARGLKKKSRFLVLHPMYPPHLLPLVEISGAVSTNPKALDLAEAYIRRLGNVPLRIKRELPGFVVNRLQAALLTEAMRLVASGACAPSDVDNAVRFGLAPRWSHLGPMQAAAINTADGFEGFGNKMGEMMVWMDRQNKNLKPWSQANIQAVSANLQPVGPEARQNFNACLVRHAQALKSAL